MEMGRKRRDERLQKVNVNNEGEKWEGSRPAGKKEKLNNWGFLRLGFLLKRGVLISEARVGSQMLPPP